MSTPLRIRVPTPLAEPAPGWFGPDRRGWLGHLLWQPLLTAGPVPGVARLVDTDPVRGRVALVATGPVATAELLARIKASFPEHGAWRVGDRIVVESGPRLVDWAAFATLVPAGRGERSYRVLSFAAESGMVLRRNGDAPSTLPETIEVHVIPDPDETWFLLEHEMIDVAIEVEPATAPAGGPWELVTPSNETHAVQLIRWHGPDQAAMVEADRRLRLAVSTVDFNDAVYRGTAVPVSSPPPSGPPAHRERIAIRLAYNVENPVREHAVGWLCAAAAPAGVDLHPVPATWTELSSGRALDDSDAVLLTWGARTADEVGGRLPAWPLTRHVYLPTATRGRAAAGIVLGGTVEPLALVLAGARAKGLQS